MHFFFDRSRVHPCISAGPARQSCDHTTTICRGVQSHSQHCLSRNGTFWCSSDSCCRKLPGWCLPVLTSLRTRGITLIILIEGCTFMHYMSKNMCTADHHTHMYLLISSILLGRLLTRCRIVTVGICDNVATKSLVRSGSDGGWVGLGSGISQCSSSSRKYSVRLRLGN